MGEWSGSCHCGAVRFRGEAEIDELTRCDCSLCRRRGALMAKVHESALTIEAGEDALVLYQWNTRRARHWFCGRCGIYPFHRKRAAPDFYGVNVGCLENFDVEAYPWRVADGLTMSVRSGEARSEWSGPRED
ncbi:MAG: GFA family protein [Phenylobacterium sp.]|uniref:GFA family protein n=1 Tax=Phenylobacterium sp. TaxID=1871053 RepID=UPI0025F2BC28|nr:GFA family protein [Phenylobacterium sp.]MBI1200082.1 GFA family protein [Phenylobacterium sp.]